MRTAFARSVEHINLHLMEFKMMRKIPGAVVLVLSLLRSGDKAQRHDLDRLQNKQIKTLLFYDIMLSGRRLRLFLGGHRHE